MSQLTANEQIIAHVIDAQRAGISNFVLQLDMSFADYQAVETQLVNAGFGVETIKSNGLFNAKITLP